MPRRKAHWRDITVPTHDGDQVISIDFNSEQEFLSVDPETGKGDVFSAYEARMVSPDGKKHKVVIRSDTLKELLASL